MNTGDVQKIYRRFGQVFFCSCCTHKHITAGSLLLKISPLSWKCGGWGVQGNGSLEQQLQSSRRQHVMLKLQCENNCFLFNMLGIADEVSYCVDMSTARICTYPQQWEAKGQPHTGQQKGQHRRSLSQQQQILWNIY